MRYRVLVVEDDPVIAGLVEKQLGLWGLEARVAEDFQHVMETFFAFDPHLVLLDIALPFFNGYYWCTQIRQHSKVPVLFLSSASEKMNIVMAMNMGGDDFVTKPFDFDVLLAKIQALLRRSYEFSAPSQLLECRGAVLDLTRATLEYHGVRMELTKNEHRILQTLMERRGEVVSRSELMEALWQTDSFVDENALSVNITRLRRRLEQAGLAEFIKTRKGLGYQVDA